MGVRAFDGRFHSFQEELGFALLERDKHGVVDAVVTNHTEVQTTDGTTQFHPLFEGSACVFFARGHRFGQMHYVTPADLADEHLFTAYFAPHMVGGTSKTGSILAGHGIDFSRAELVDDGDTAFLSVQAGLGVFIASHLCDEFARKYDVLSVDLEAGLGAAVAGVAWRGQNELVDAFIRCAEHVLKARRGASPAQG